MITVLAQAVVQFVVLQTVDGREVHVNPRLVTSLGKPSQTGKPFDTRVHCVVSFTDGKFVTVVEECDSIRRRLEEAKR